uniref:Uncharacterized protein n=2 Tax=Anguilla anguilla TaxID=7936 RepID=A0A0E9SKL4_ANGAN
MSTLKKKNSKSIQGRYTNIFPPKDHMALSGKIILGGHHFSGEKMGVLYFKLSSLVCIF